MLQVHVPQLKLQLTAIRKIENWLPVPWHCRYNEFFFHRNILNEVGGLFVNFFDLGGFHSNQWLKMAKYFLKKRASVAKRLQKQIFFIIFLSTAIVTAGIFCANWYSSLLAVV